jgi:hypothetical protein
MKEKLELDKYEMGIIINSLNLLRNNQIMEEKPTEPVDDLIMKIVKVYEISEKKNNLVKCLRKDSGRSI